MADKKISELTNITGANLADDDEFVVVDSSASETKSITKAELKVAILGDNEAGTFSGVSLATIAESKGITAVDVFVYDTSKDSDGGAWRKRTQHTSWYNEMLNTATRGSRREFPAVAVIVAESNKVTIYDGDDPALPMWRVTNRVGPSGTSFWRSSVANALALFAINGKVVFVQYVNTPTSSQGLAIIDFAADNLVRIAGASGSGGEGLPVSADASTTALFPVVYGAEKILVSLYPKDVAMTVLPDAPVDSATGLPVSLILVGTDGGLSVIHDNGAVYDSAKTTACSDVTIDTEGMIRAAFSDGQVITYDPAVIIADGFTGTVLSTSTTPALKGTTTTLAKAASGSNTGIALLAENKKTPTEGMISYISSTYSTGWMNGDIKGAFLANSPTEDRSVNNTPLIQVGSLTAVPVTTGAELTAYSGFSSSNYLRQSYNSTLNFGTGDFCVMGWVKFTTTANATLFSRSDAALSGSSFYIYSSSGQIATVCGSTSGTLTDGKTYNDGVWHFVVQTRRSSVEYIYIDGRLAASRSRTGSVTNASAIITVGSRADSTWPLDGGSLALWRISATAPTVEQIKKIYEDEKVIFRENAACTLYGSSDAVTALAHDDVTGLLHVGTSAGRSDFQGLLRVNNTTTAVTTTISAHNELIVEQ